MAGLVIIGLGGFVGAVARYLLDVRISTMGGGAFPWGTFVVNCIGCLAVGFLFAVLVERAVLPHQLRGPLMIGFLASFTTFSTFALESWRMIEDGAFIPALLNIGGSIVLGIAAVIAGVALGRAV